MDVKKLLQAEAEFLRDHPLGFQDPKMVEIGKKHKMDKLIEFAQDVLAPTKFANNAELLQQWIKLVSRSSMVSMFEKPKFKDLINSLGPKEKQTIADGLYEQLHGDEEAGFNQILDILRASKMAKWSLISVAPAYYKPNDDIFMKPTTVKGIVSIFELEGLVYKPQPSWPFYKEYRAEMLNMKHQVSETLAPNNAAFSGFLMMTMKQVAT